MCSDLGLLLSGAGTLIGRVAGMVPFTPGTGTGIERPVLMFLITAARLHVISEAPATATWVFVAGVLLHPAATGPGPEGRGSGSSPCQAARALQILLADCAGACRTCRRDASSPISA